MKYPLTVFTPILGAASETFIQRHALQLYPQGTSVIYTATPPRLYWDTHHPKLSLAESLPFIQRLYCKVYHTLTPGDRRITKDPIQARAVREFLIQNNTKVILGEYLDQSLWLLPIAKSLGIKFYAHAHGYDVSTNLKDAFWRKEYLKYRLADGIITMNQVTKQKLVQLGIDKKLIHVIPYGVEAPCFAKEFRETDMPVKCLAVGRMVEKKAPLKLLAAFRKALAISPNLHLDFIGSGDLLPQVEAYIEANNMQAHVTLHHERPNAYVKQKMKEADIFIQHSITDPFTGDQEGTPVAILEAMSYSLPVISTFHGGIPEAVENGTNGFLVEEGDIEGMAIYISKLAKDKKLLCTLGTASNKRFLEKFSWEEEKRQLLHLLELV